MKKALFDDLIASVKQAGRIHRGEAKPSRKFVFAPEDVRPIRETRTSLNPSSREVRPQTDAARRCGCRRSS